MKRTCQYLGSMLLAALLMVQHAAATPADRYTEEQPLVIVSDWELPPYEFSNLHGKPAGFHVDVLDYALNKMKLPHTFVQKEWKQAAQMFDRHEADLILDPVQRYRSQPYQISRSTLNYYKIKVASRTDTKPINTFEELKNAQGVVMRTNDVVSMKVLDDHDLLPFMTVEYHSTREALSGLVNGSFQYFIWGEEPLKWKMKELDLTKELKLDGIDIPAGEIHFVGYDRELIELIDDQVARMEYSGELGKLHDKWFNPERVHNDTSPVVLYIILGVVLAAIVLMLFNRLVRQRVNVAMSKNIDLENMMLRALSMGNYSVIEYDTMARQFSNRHGHLLPKSHMNNEELAPLLHPDDRDGVMNELARMVSGEKDVWDAETRWNAGTPEAPQWLFVHGHAFTEKDESGHVTHIVLNLKDMTEEFEQERKDSELASKYIKIFDSTLVAMSFYDKDGWLIDLNENMRSLCQFDENGERYFRETNMFDVPFFLHDFDPKSHEHFHVCQHMYYPEAGIDKHIELRIRPIYDEDELQYYIITARDVSAERKMYLEQAKQDKELHKVNDITTRYEQEMHYLLENSQMWVWRSNLKEKRISVSRSLQKEELSQSFEEYMDGLEDEFKEVAMKTFGNMEGSDHTFNITLRFKHTMVSDQPQWLSTSGMPLYDKKGNLTGHFGIVRDVTNLMDIQEKLKKETNRAEDSGKLKSVFLANMTHEIRTPLNAIVGFSDLLQVIDDPTERREFIRIIRNNCDMLIRLINDIIEASNMNQGPLAIEAVDVDWAVAFNDICQTLAQRVQEPGVEFIVDNPVKSFLTHVDKGRLQQVITNFTTNAVKYTHQGHIKVGWEYKDGGIYMYCEDTGAGIPKEKQASVFERFVKLNDYVQGTGLGLSICKSIADRCGGRIGVTSEGEGHGSTFWLWIPCERKDI